METIVQIFKIFALATVLSLFPAPFTPFHELQAQTGEQLVTHRIIEAKNQKPIH